MITPTTTPAPLHDDLPAIIRWARVLLTLALIPIGRGAFRSEYGEVPLLSDLDLAVHEFGHILFTPFGETMMVLGGSLTQVAFPLIFAGYFLWARDSRRDVHAAMACLWWTSINMLGVAIYAADARHGQMMLVNGQTGQEGGPHDWTILFSTMGVLDRGDVIAAKMRGVAALLCIASIVGGLVAAWRSGRPNSATPAES
jgi:hypothetical protein